MANNKKYEEVKLEKGAAQAIFGNFNGDIKPKKPNANGTKKKTGTTSQKRGK